MHENRDYKSDERNFFLNLCKICSSDFHLSVESNSPLLWFCISTLGDCLQNPRTFSTNHDSFTNVFPHFSRLHVFASCFDWFTGLSVSFVIGQSDYFGFGFNL